MSKYMCYYKNKYGFILWRCEYRNYSLKALLEKVYCTKRDISDCTSFELVEI